MNPRAVPRLLAGAAILLAPACSAWPTGQIAADTPPLTGHVAFPAPAVRSSQALITEVANYATVSLINASLNRTETTTVTTASGSFQFVFPKTFKPSTTDAYYMEAVKGLSSNLPGKNAARLRTLVQFQGAWQSLTNGVPGEGSVNLDFTTTAIAIAAALRHNNPTPIDFSALMGSYVGSFAPAGGLSGADVSTLTPMVQSILAQDGDPLAGITLVGGTTWVTTNTTSTLAIASIVPASAPVGANVTITGAGFGPTPGSNSVVFSGGKAGTVTSAGPNQLVVTVPYGAVSGPVSLTVGNLTTSTPSFSVTGALTGGISTTSSAVTSGQISP